MSEDSLLKKKYEEIVVDQRYWAECRKCGFKWKSYILEWVKIVLVPTVETFALG